MIMSGRLFNRASFFVVALLFVGVWANAQTYSSYAPYSIYGIGDLMSKGTAYNKTMGGVGIAGRSNRFINPLNPASVTARDSLSFMADFSLYQDNKYFRQGDLKSVSNTFNVNDLIMSFPIYRSSAMMVGIVPYSGTGFGYSFGYQDPNIIAHTGDITYTAAGKGGLYQAFAAAGVTFFKRMSLGFEYNLIFGQTSKDYYETFSESSFNGVKNGFDLKLKSSSFKFGLQYEQPIGSTMSVVFGATYDLNLRMGGTVTGYRFSSGTTLSDTLYFKELDLSKDAEVRLANEIGVGASFRFADKIMVEFDYTRADWRNSGFDTTMGFMGNTTQTAVSSVFKSSVAEAYRLGFEYVPNRNDIRYYYKKVAYRAGAYYKKDYFTLDGHNIGTVGITLGATLPVVKWYNGLTLGLEFGQRGALDDKLFRERFINFTVGLNIFDIWFMRRTYE